MQIPIGHGYFTEIDSEDLPKLDGWQVRIDPYRIYAMAYAHGMTVPVSRLILGLEKGDPRMADHIDSSRTLDNRKCNLRIVDKFQNQWNTHRKFTNKSGHKGVSWHAKKQKWIVSIVVRGQTIFLGWFPKEALDLAAATYEDAARRYFGEYART